MTALDETRTARPPATWSADKVRERLFEAFTIERKMPGQGTRRIASTWPAAVLHDFSDVLHWDDARERVWKSWENAKGAYSWEVSRMEETFSWLGWLPPLERRDLQAWAFAKAYHIPVARIMRRHRLTKTQFYRRRDAGAQAIADRLNKDRVTVR